MLKLADADARILVKRIAKAIRKARYCPAEIKDEEAAAFEVLLRKRLFVLPPTQCIRRSAADSRVE